MRSNPHVSIAECDSVYRPDDDTYLLLDCLDVTRGERVLEIGCGSGILSIHCAKAGGNVTAVDINPRAVECTRRNAVASGVDIEVMHSNLFDEVEGEFELIIFNPPYLPVEEQGDLEMAWSGGEGGIEVTDRFLDQALEHLAEGGRILLLISSRMDMDGLEKVLSRFHMDILASRRFFFEELRVLRLESAH